MNGWLVILKAYGEWELLDIVPSRTKTDAMWALSLHLGKNVSGKRHADGHYEVDGRHLVVRADVAVAMGYLTEVAQ